MIKIEDDIIYVNGEKLLCPKSVDLYRDTKIYCNIHCKRVKVEDDYVYICDNQKHKRLKMEVIIL